MLKKTITYKDFNDEEVTEDFFFHLSQAELIELEVSHEGGLSAALERIVAAEDMKNIIGEFKNIILSAYGKKSDDGRRFIKNQELRDELESTEAYSTLFMELVTDTDAAVEFINGIIPAGLMKETAKLAKTDEKPTLEPVPPPVVQVVSRAEIAQMSSEEMKQFEDRVKSGEAVLGE